MLDYGVLRGRVDVFKRENDLSTPHLQIRVVDGHDRAWRVPVNPTFRIPPAIFTNI